jgi:Glycosyl transferase 4-like domain
VLFIAWSRTAGRSQEIAHALGGLALPIHPARLAGKSLFPVRYLYNTARTLSALVRLRPSAVIVTNPPLVSAVVVGLWAVATGRPFVLDSHPSSFGAKDHAVSRRLIAVHRWLARRASTTLVTTQAWVDVLESWGAHGTIAHEAPPLWSTSDLAGPGGRRVLFPGVFAGDEPIDEVIALARLRPELDVRVTGDIAKCPPRISADLPGNVTLLGYLDTAAFAAEVGFADVILALTTEPTSVMRAAYEAVYARRPLVVSDWPAGREAFPHAIHTENDAPKLAGSVESALGAGRDGALLELAAKEQTHRWNQQLENMRAAISRRSGAEPTRARSPLR